MWQKCEFLLGLWAVDMCRCVYSDEVCSIFAGVCCVPYRCATSSQQYVCVCICISRALILRVESIRDSLVASTPLLTHELKHIHCLFMRSYSSHYNQSLLSTGPNLFWVPVSGWGESEWVGWRGRKSSHFPQVSCLFFNCASNSE